VPAPKSRYRHLVESLPELTADQRNAFALVAVEQMLREHDEQLAGLGEETPRTARERRKHLRWASATRRYAAELERFAAGLAAGAATVEIQRSAEGSVYLYLDRRPLVVTSMDLRRPETLEERIVEDWCARFDCVFLDDLQAATALEPPAGTSPRPASAARARWLFGDRGVPTFATSDGLVFEFDEIDDREHKQRLCLEVAAELRVAAALIMRAEREGYGVDWEAVGVVPGSGGARLVLDRHGTFVRANLPRLALAPGLLASARPWLRARLAGKTYEQRFVNAERALGPLLAEGTGKLPCVSATGCDQHRARGASGTITAR
jgi:hypothetical protein